MTVQRDGEALCWKCVNAINEKLRGDRKAQLAARPRCECCKRAGTWIVGGVRLCGHHKKQTMTARSRQTASWGILGLLGAPTLTRDEILNLATESKP